MCGLSAIISSKPCCIDDIKNMNDLINHRGPDDEGYFFHNSEHDEIFVHGKDTDLEAIQNLDLKKLDDLYSSKYKIFFGHRRLSIVDTTFGGHQPMRSGCKRFSIIYNGEIYNAKSLRQELTSKNFSFSSSSDTEVLLNAYIHWGEDCLKRLNGMFSFLIFDSKKNEIFVARDRFGIKPLYYFKKEGSLYFGSEIKQFSGLKSWSANLNKKMAYDYLNWGQTDHTNETLFEGVFQVPAGSFCKFNAFDCEPDLAFQSWYQIESKKNEINYDEAVLNFSSIFHKSVKRRLRADVPIGTCLSGGLDSSSIACTINNQIKNQSQLTFSSCSKEKKYDEFEYVEEILQSHPNIESHRIEVEHKDFWGEIDHIIYHHDEPFLSPSVYAEWSIYKRVKSSKVKVTLDGHGADEILYGYYTFFGPLLSTKLRKFKIISYLTEIINIKKLHNYNLFRLMGMSIRSFIPSFFKEYLYKILGMPTEHSNWINHQVLGNPRSKFEFNDKNIYLTSKEQLLKFSVPKQLKWCDRDSMAHSVESRVPFLDYELVDFLYSIPDEYKFHKGITKRILRDSMKNIIPLKIKNRINKLGFVTPAEEWVFQNKDLYKQRLDEAIHDSQGILKDDKCKERFYNMIDKKIPFDHSFWRVIFFAKWLKVFKVNVN